jgi:hypothetical protein
MDPEMRRLTRKYSIISAVTTLVTHPVPAMDELMVIPIHYYFSAKVARMRNVKLRELPWSQVHKIVLGGAVVRFGTDLAFGFVPVAGAFAHALTAKVLTDVLGEYLDEALSRPGSPPPLTIRTIKNLMWQRLKPHKRSTSIADPT